MKRKSKKDRVAERSGISPKQRELYDIIKNYIRLNKHSPSYEELKQLIGSNSKSHVHGLVHQLHQRGWIKFNNGRNRSISIV